MIERDKQKSSGLRSLPEARRQIKILDGKWDATQLLALQVEAGHMAYQHRSPSFLPTHKAVQDYIGSSR
jgi:hypothetical protein